MVHNNDEEDDDYEENDGDKFDKFMTVMMMI